MAKSPLIAAKVPVFASVLMPSYLWDEYETDTLQGVTRLPKGKSVSASVTVPDLTFGGPDGQAVRAHEMLHIAFTPDIHPVATRLAKEGLTSGVVLQLVEDMRLAHIAKRNDLSREDAYFSTGSLLGLVNQILDSTEAIGASLDGKQRCAVALVATLGSMYGQSLQGDVGAASTMGFEANLARLRAVAQEAYGSTGPGALDRVLASNPEAVMAARLLYAHASDVYGRIAHGPGGRPARAKRERAAFEDVYRYAHKILESLLYSEPPPPPSPTSSDEGVSKPSKTEVGDNKTASKSIDSAEAMMGTSLAASAAKETNKRKAAAAKEAPQTAPTPGLDLDSGDAHLTGVAGLELSLDVDPAVTWAPMDIVVAPLERSFKVRVPRRGRPSLDGEIPRHWSRWFADRAILDNRGRRPGGTLLVDVSGSMRWSREQTLALINATPALTIALYSSRYDNSARFWGRLTLIARDGKAAAQDYNWRSLHGPANACDGPALAWLARQPGPRVWFSDGAVTVAINRRYGGGESVTPQGIEDATRLVKLGNITRTTDVDDVVRIFSGLAPVNPATSKDCGAGGLITSREAKSAFTLAAARHWRV